MKRFDAIVIGAGHKGPADAAYLAKARLEEEIWPEIHYERNLRQYS